MYVRTYAWTPDGGRRTADGRINLYADERTCGMVNGWTIWMEYQHNNCGIFYIERQYRRYSVKQLLDVFPFSMYALRQVLYYLLSVYIVNTSLCGNTVIYLLSGNIVTTLCSMATRLILVICRRYPYGKYCIIYSLVTPLILRSMATLLITFSLTA